MEPLPKERSDPEPEPAGPDDAAASMEPLPKERSDVVDDVLRPLGIVGASMEPLPKERSDDHDGLRAGRKAGMASMEPLPKERSDGQGIMNPCSWQGASMEPLPKERSDYAGSPWANLDSIASMEPLPKERSDNEARQRTPQGLPRLNGAAPEGAERHSTAWTRARAGTCLNGAAPEGAERQLHDPAEWPDAVVASMEPLPKERSDAEVTQATGSATGTPQWSRSRRSGATRGCTAA